MEFQIDRVNGPKGEWEREHTDTHTVMQYLVFCQLNAKCYTETLLCVTHSWGHSTNETEK